MLGVGPRPAIPPASQGLDVGAHPRAIPAQGSPDSAWNRLSRCGKSVGKPRMTLGYRTPFLISGILYRNHRTRPRHLRQPGVQPQPNARAFGINPGVGIAVRSYCSYEFGLTVTTNWSLTSLPSASRAVTVIVAVPVDIGTTFSVE